MATQPKPDKTPSEDDRKTPTTPGEDPGKVEPAKEPNE